MDRRLVDVVEMVRRVRQWSISDLCRKAKIGRATYYRFRTIPEATTIITLTALADALGLRLSVTLEPRSPDEKKPRLSGAKYRGLCV